MSTPPSEKFAWLDIETSGLSPQHHHLLELALVVTDSNLVELESFNVLTLPVGSNVSAVRLSADPVVQHMHDANGLWEALVAGDGVFRRWEAEAMALSFLRRHFPADGQAPPMCGSSVHFDRAFLATHMPELERAFFYRNLDTSSFGIACGAWAPSVLESRPRDSKAHRALDDARYSIELMKHYRSALILGAHDR